MPMSHAEEFVSKCTFVTLNLVGAGAAGTVSPSQIAAAESTPVRIAESKGLDIVRSIVVGVDPRTAASLAGFHRTATWASSSLSANRPYWPASLRNSALTA